MGAARPPAMKLLLKITLIMGLSACASAPDDRLSQRCTSPQGYSVSYPSGWQTNSGDVVPLCSAFDPDPFEIPRDSEMPFEIAVTLDVDAVAFETTAGPSRWENVLSSERTTIAGRPAIRVEAESTGEGLADRGMRSLRYVVDLGGGKSLIATTWATGTSYERDKEILARMMQTLSLQ